MRGSISRAWDQFLHTILTYPRAWQFIRHNKLWRGMGEYKWVVRLLTAVAILTSLYLFREMRHWFSSHQDDGFSMMFFGGDSLVYSLGKDTANSLTNGSLKWVVLILLEVVIYHFMRKTLHVILGKDMPDANKLKPFLNAQMRMIVVSAMAAGLEIGLKVVGSIAFGIVSYVDWLEPWFIYTAQFGLIGFAIVDNYNEQFGLSVGQSLRYTRMGYIGVCLGLGLPLVLMLKIPLIGTIAGPILASVTAGIVMKELSDLHTVGYVPSEKEQAQAGTQNQNRRRSRSRSQNRSGQEWEDEELIL